MGNLHQLLAVKKEAKQRANEIAGETKKALGSKHLYFGSHKSYQPFDEEDSTRLPDEHEQMGYIVGEKMDWFGKNFGRLIDLELQIDRTNELARADLAVDGFNMNNVPAPFLLDFIGFLDKIRNVYAGIPVLGRGNERVMPVIEEGLKNERPEVRRYCALALGLAGHQAAIPHLNVLIDDDDAEHDILATALGEIASQESI